MVRKLVTNLAAASAVAVLAPLLVPLPAGATTTWHLPAPSDAGDVAASELRVPTAPDGRHLELSGHEHDDDHDHDARAIRSVEVATPSGPEAIVLGDVPLGAHLAVRSRHATGWTPWAEVVADPDEAPDDVDVAPTMAVGPIWVGDDTQSVEVAVLDGDVEALVLEGIHLAPLASDSPNGFHAAGLAGTGDPSFIRPRNAWATTDMGWACNTGPTAADELRAMVVHHTAGTNDYAADQVPQVIRAIWHHHVRTNGWCDVAYAFLVDRYGGVWEGRQGGIERAIIGGHARGFNTGTTSVAQLGNYHTAQPTAALTDATRRIIGWKLGHHGLDPAGETTVTNRTGETFRGVPDGGEVPVPVVSGHRDLGSTACPGDHTYETLPMLRAQSRDGVHLVALLELFLQQVPTPGAYSTWLAVVDQRGLAAAALRLARSEAYSGLIIDDLYQRVLGRPADQAGKDYWLRVLASGTRVEDVGVQFYGSAEYVQRMGGFRPWIEALYDNLLHRTPDAAGLAFWLGLATTRATPPEIAEGFYLSLESRRDRVARLYETVLGRGPDPGGHAHWATRLLDTDDVLLAVDLSLSDEFYLRATR